MIPIVPKPVKAEITGPSEYLYTEDDIKYVQDPTVPASGYRLSVGKDGVTVRSSDDDGAFYGKMTVREWLSEGKKLTDLEIYDYPRYAHRGFMLDCARHFFGIDVVKRLLDIIAILKFNVFHWHLTDDQGWRMQVDKYPLLTEIGSKRTATRGDGKPVQGYYTKAEMKEVVEYAKALHIDVMPEIDLPGHMAAAIAAYPYLSCTGEQIAVKESFGIHKEVLCPGKESVYEFVEGVLKEAFEIFPYKYIHLGGDEALRINWINCEDCQRVMAENGLKDEDELQAYFMGKINEFCNKNGKTVINWNDGMVGENVADNIMVHYWQESDVNRRVAVREINKGKGGIISPFGSYYLDYPHGMTPLKKTFDFNPELPGVTRKDCILGIEAPLWAEYVESENDIYKRIFPRLLAVAERAWSPWHTDYKDFKARAEQCYKMFDNKGIVCDTISKADPSLIGRAVGTIVFGLNALDKTLVESGKRIKLNQKMLDKKYGKKR